MNEYQERERQERLVETEKHEVVCPHSAPQSWQWCMKWPCFSLWQTAVPDTRGNACMPASLRHCSTILSPLSISFTIPRCCAYSQMLHNIWDEDWLHRTLVGMQIGFRNRIIVLSKWVQSSYNSYLLILISEDKYGNVVFSAEPALSQILFKLKL